MDVVADIPMGSAYIAGIGLDGWCDSSCQSGRKLDRRRVLSFRPIDTSSSVAGQWLMCMADSVGCHSMPFSHLRFSLRIHSLHAFVSKGGIVRMKKPHFEFRRFNAEFSASGFIRMMLEGSCAKEQAFSMLNIVRPAQYTKPLSLLSLRRVVLDI
ncbi:hypothetical protein DL98DRAFT_48899 [Cadophora sp. DSE1049]|nr:hypothetical protein DL98DRAFT_48899 [Cadophora sp. DSE1049]